MSQLKPSSNYPASLVESLKNVKLPLAENSIYSAQIEQFWDAQEKMLEETEAFAQHWFERRHEAVRTALETARNVSEANPSEPTEAIQNLTEWQRNSAARLVADAQEWLEIMTRCATYVAETEAEAVDKTVDDVTARARSATKSSNSDPV
ncbi:hypothetical protein GFB49_04955 [Epibacterium sp. SM1979]|uniref:Phasin domain-containing protein n=1 Tax=Tritonibacter litoralis TaxID=2662264 RepID=A0A843YES0_9RHOB|nr:phasin family protein [Tritonibacter litoralis]MQQ07792.1 hypothetical protein [Tritonibacter litoralis]